MGAPPFFCVYIPGGPAYLRTNFLPPETTMPR